MTDGSSSAYLFLVHKKYSHREGPPELGDAGDGFFFFFHLDVTMESFLPYL